MDHRRQVARAVSTFSCASPNTCQFCAHVNAANSKFCSECGRALRLVPCPRCGAVNDVKENSCYECHHTLSGRTTDKIASGLSAARDFAPSAYQPSQEGDVAAIFAEIKQLYRGVSPNRTDDVSRSSPGTNVVRPDDITRRLSSAEAFTPSAYQLAQESDEAIFAEIKQLYHGVSPNGTDNVSRPSPGTNIVRPDDITPRLSSAEAFASSACQLAQESDEAATRRRIKELYIANLQRRTPRFEHPWPVVKGGRIFRRGLSQTIIGIAILAAIAVLGFYEYHQRILGGGELRSLVVKSDRNGNEDPADARDVQRNLATLKTIPGRSARRTRTEHKTVIWDAEKVNGFWKGAAGKASNALANLIAKTPKPATASEPDPAAAPAPDPTPIALTDKKRSPPKTAMSSAVPALPLRDQTVSVPISAVKSEVASATPPAIISFAIVPWGEIYVDGQKRGVNPPMRELKLSPGQYEVEVRNTTFPAYFQKIKVDAGTSIKIKHHFR